MAEQQKKVTFLSELWPGRELAFMPGDLSKWLAQGLGLSAPMIVTPYNDGPEPNYYGWDTAGDDPISSAPTQLAGGGILYFSDGIDVAKLRTALEVMQVRLDPKSYALFSQASANTIEDRYLEQVRIASPGALGHFFGVEEDAALLQDQPIPVGEYIETFIAEQKDKWNDEYAFSSKLSGTLGGDGDWAKESLGFGFAVENTYWGVYRLWSRPWLCTK